MSNVLSVESFGGGVVLEGAADVQRTDELQLADGYEIGPRGQLVAASDLSTTGLSALNDSGGSALTRLHGLHPILLPTGPGVLAVGDNAANEYTVRLIDPAAGTSTLIGAIPVLLASVQYGAVVTASTFPQLNGTTAVLFSIGARAFRYPKSVPGTYVLLIGSAGHTFGPISDWDALGTGTNGEFFGGTKSQQLFFRGIESYNGFALGYGFDSTDATNGDGPGRVMFSNPGQPLKWGNDPQDPGPYTDHTFDDSDAIPIGGNGSIVRSVRTWAGRAWVGAADGLHYIEGYGRESFLTNGAVPVQKSKSTVGPRALIEGPDGLLYGVDARAGLWAFNGAQTDPVGLRLRDFNKKSIGYWDLIWTDTGQSTLYPSQSNQDLVWMWADREKMEVWVVIPFCNATAGYGAGSDSVIIKYNTTTGGFTRQVFAGLELTSGAIFEQEASAPRSKFITQPGQAPNLARYEYKATPASSPVMPSVLPVARFGEYAPHGPDGVGVSNKIYLTLAWESSAALPLVFTVAPYVDQSAVGSAVTVTIGATAPGSPADGDVWLDTSGTDTNLGNGTAGAFTPAHPNDYLLKLYKASFAKWLYVYDGGMQGTRASFGIPFLPARGTRTKFLVTCTSAAGRYQIEQLGLQPATIRSDK